MILELQNICFTRDNKKILDNVSLKLESGVFTTITGPNGSGKSTLVKIIMGIEKQDSGKIILDGQDISDLAINERANLGMSFAFQQPVKFKGITVYDLIKIAVKKELTKNEACNILSSVGLCAKEYIDREVNSSLSGGELKRIEIATAFKRDTKVTIFDEPEAGIDLWSFSNLINVFEEIHTKREGLIIIISHQERIIKIADSVVLMKDGKVEKIGTSEEILLEDINVTRACRKRV